MSCVATLRIGEVRYHISGKYEIQDDCTLVINELPLRSWTSDYKAFLEGMMTTKDAKGNATVPFITDYKEYHTDTVVHFVVTMTPEHMEAAKKEGIESKFKLTSKVSTTNMHLFDEKGAITKYTTPESILAAFMPLRLKAYEKRRVMLIRQAESELKRMSNKVRFIIAVVDGELSIGRKKKSVLVEELESMSFDRMPKTQKVAAAPTVEEGDAEEGAEEAADTGASYDYLLSMPLWNLTQEKVEELMEEQTAKTTEVQNLHNTTDKVGDANTYPGHPGVTGVMGVIHPNLNLVDPSL